MHTKHILLAIFTAALLQGAAAVAFENPQGVTKDILFWVPLVANAFLFFTWAQLDAAERNYRLSSTLKVGIVGLAVIFIPVYLVKSRSQGERLKAIGKFLLAAAVFFICATLGGALAIPFGSN